MRKGSPMARNFGIGSPMKQTRGEKPVATPDRMREHYGSYKEYAKEYEGMTDDAGNPVKPMSVEDWQKLNDTNVTKSHFPDNQFSADMDKYRNYLGWAGDAVREKHAIQKEKGTYEEFRFTAGFGAKLVRDGVMTEEEVDKKLAEQKKKDETPIKSKKKKKK